jgi:light-regulated signal transduction histidine kinase (bacteriophytochrome)
MNKMTEDLLTYARMRSIAPRMVEVDVTALAKEIVETLRDTYPQTRYAIAEGLSLYCDRTMLRVVLENLIDNGSKYSQNGSQPLVEVGQDEQGFYVRDNGIGLDMKYADKLFLPFERLHPQGLYDGTGMGLANVKRILDRHSFPLRIGLAG